MTYLPEPLPADPLSIFESWLDQAMAERARPNPNSMSLATVNASGQTSVRVVLCKQLVVEPGYLVFYTNYDSAKSADIAGNPRASFLMHWDEHGRQIRGEGLLVKSPAEESDAYFISRDRGSRIGAWASRQSSPVASREALEAQFASAEARFAGIDVPRPDNWGGYRLWFSALELWLNLESRLHDRARWERELASTPAGVSASEWQCIGRLQP